MRLIKQVERLEGAGAASAREEPAGVGLAWSDSDERLDVAQLRPGEWIAADVHMLGQAVAGVDQVIVRERFTPDPQDLGWVLDASGVVVGRVTAIEGSLLTLRYEGPAPSRAPPAPGAATSPGGA